MESEKEHQKELSNILGISKGIQELGYSTPSAQKNPATWPEIYTQIGRLLQKANTENTTMRIEGIGSSLMGRDKCN